MQQRAVIRIADVFVVQLPVAWNLLPQVANDLRLSLHEKAVDLRQAVRSDEVVERLGGVAVGAEDQSTTSRHPQRSQTMVLLFEAGRHAALAVVALLQRHSGEVARQVVRPQMVRTGVALGVAAHLVDDARTAMGAAVLERMDRAVLG